MWFTTSFSFSQSYERDNNQSIGTGSSVAYIILVTEFMWPLPWVVSLSAPKNLTSAVQAWLSSFNIYIYIAILPKKGHWYGPKMANFLTFVKWQTSFHLYNLFLQVVVLLIHYPPNFWDQSTKSSFLKSWVRCLLPCPALFIFRSFGIILVYYSL